MPGHPAHIGVDGHPVIVQNHDHRLVRGPGVIQSLEAQTAAHGTVACILCGIYGTLPRNLLCHHGF